MTAPLTCRATWKESKANIEEIKGRFARTRWIVWSIEREKGAPPAIYFRTNERRSKLRATSMQSIHCLRNFGGEKKKVNSKSPEDDINNLIVHSRKWCVRYQLSNVTIESDRSVSQLAAWCHQMVVIKLELYWFVLTHFCFEQFAYYKWVCRWVGQKSSRWHKIKTDSERVKKLRANVWCYETPGNACLSVYLRIHTQIYCYDCDCYYYCNKN